MKKNLLFMLTGLLLVSIIHIALAEEATKTLSSGDWEYQLLEDDTIAITKYTGEEEQVLIPSELEGKTVSKLIGFGWSGCKEITIPGSVVTIDQNPFSSCYSLANMSPQHRKISPTQ